MVDHIDYIAKRIGVDHVGIGTDFNHGSGIEGFDDASEALNVTVELLNRGYSEEDIKKIWGGNFIRVWQAAEAKSG
jgi:membrane dipeptidase